MSRRIGLAPLTVLDTPPDQLIREAAAAGFDFVGLRVLPVTDQEPRYDLRPSSRLLNRTLEAINETGLWVEDTEFLCIDEGTSRDVWLPALEAAQALGAKSFTVTAGDENLERLSATLSCLVADAAEFGIIPTLEPITYRSVHSITQAAEIARLTGSRVLADTLHMARFGASPGELRGAADVVDMLQLCDSSSLAPTDVEGLVYESRAARLAPGEGDQALGDLVRALPPTTLISLEVPNEYELAKRGSAKWIQHLHENTRAFLNSIEPEHAEGMAS